MAKQQKMSIEVNELKINLQTINQNEYFSLTDLAKFQSEDSKKIIQNWLRAKSTMSFLAAWETMYNPDFKGVNYDAFKNTSNFPETMYNSDFKGIDFDPFKKYDSNFTMQQS